MRRLLALTALRTTEGSPADSTHYPRIPRCCAARLHCIHQHCCQCWPYYRWSCSDCYWHTSNASEPIRNLFEWVTNFYPDELLRNTATNIEDKSLPFNDLQLVKLLEQCNIKIARRTVAKYRDLLNIPVSEMRKMLAKPSTTPAPLNF